MKPVRGYVRIFAGDELVAEGWNHVVKSGMVLLAERIEKGNSVVLPNEYRLGDSAALTTDEMTGLQGSQIASLDASLTRDSNVLKWSGSFTYQEQTPKDCREIGLFQKSESGGTMLTRFLPQQLFKLTQGTPVRIYWEITIGE
jgi:hypothetical protein